MSDTPGQANPKITGRSSSRTNALQASHHRIRLGRPELPDRSLLRLSEQMQPAGWSAGAAITMALTYEGFDPYSQSKTNDRLYKSGNQV